MWIRFTAPFDWKPKRNITQSFKTGDTFNATRECAEAAIAANAAVALRKATRESEPVVQPPTDTGE
jgi:hypothetical protein